MQWGTQRNRLREISIQLQVVSNTISINLRYSFPYTSQICKHVLFCYVSFSLCFVHLFLLHPFLHENYNEKSVNSTGHHQSPSAHHDHITIRSHSGARLPKQYFLDQTILFTYYRNTPGNDQWIEINSLRLELVGPNSSTTLISVACNCVYGRH